MIQEIIDEVLKPKKERIRSGLISPSSLGQCYRRQYWSRANEPVSNPIDSRTLRVFAMGHMVERFIVDNLKQRYNDWGFQVEVNKDDIHGFLDIESPEEIMDVKSQHSRKFWYNTKDANDGKDIKDMFYNNWLQVMTYAWIRGKNKGRLIFVSKDDLSIQEYCLELDNYWKNEIDMELTKIRYYYDNKTLPPAQPRLYGGEETKKECSFCSYKKKCEEYEKNNKTKV